MLRMCTRLEYQILQSLSEKPFFSTEDVSELLRITPASAHVLCSRYVKKGIFMRPKKNFYILDRNWERYDTSDFFHLANYLQVPSYISCISAMSFHELTTQAPRNWIESVSLKRSIHMDVRDVTFNYYKFEKTLYFDFEKRGDVFIATKEKSVADACHLTAYSRYAVDWHAIETDALDKKHLAEVSAAFPERTKRMIREVCRI